MEKEIAELIAFIVSVFMGIGVYTLVFKILTDKEENSVAVTFLRKEYLNKCNALATIAACGLGATVYYEVFFLLAYITQVILVFSIFFVVIFVATTKITENGIEF